MTTVDVYNAPVEIKKAHDVRRLRGCAICGGLGRDDSMVETAAFYHGRCFIAEFGMGAFLALPQEQTWRLMLDDIGPGAMRLLIDQERKDD